MYSILDLEDEKVETDCTQSTLQINCFSSYTMPSVRKQQAWLQIQEKILIYSYVVTS